MGSAECSDEDIIDFYKKQLDEQKRINDQLLDALASTSAALRSATATNNQLMSLSQPAWEDRGAEHKGSSKQTVIKIIPLDRINLKSILPSNAQQGPPNFYRG